MKKESKHISIAIQQDLLKKLDEGNFNKSKLIDELLSKHFSKNKKK
jgi:metal-responsive CopG/Arc/MetJ family transcriptional regulator